MVKRMGIALFYAFKSLISYNLKTKGGTLMSLYEGIKTAIIYGAGKGGAITYQHLVENGIEVIAFIDDFKSGEYFGKPIYHKPEHFYEIPTFIKSIVPEYKIWLLNNELWLDFWDDTKVFCKV